MTSISPIVALSQARVPTIKREVKLTEILEVLIRAFNPTVLSPTRLPTDWVNGIVASVRMNCSANAMRDLFSALFLEESSEVEVRELFLACPMKDRLSFLIYRADGANSEDPQYGEHEILSHPQRLKSLLSSLSEEDGEIYRVFKMWEGQALRSIKDSLVPDALAIIVMGVAMRGDLEVLRFLIDGREISQQYLEMIVWNTAKGGHEDVMRFLLSDHRSFSQECLERAVRIAAEEGHEAVLRFLLSEHGSISQECLGWALKNAAQGGHEAVVRFLLSEHRSISQEGLERAVRIAAEEGHEAVLRFLLSEHRSISQECLGWALKNAAQGGHEAVVRLLLSVDGDIDSEQFKDVVKSAASRGHLALTQMLLSDSRAGGLENLGYAVMAAALGGHEDVVKFLLSLSREIDQWHLNSTLFFLSDNHNTHLSNLHIAKALLEGRTITPAMFGGILTNAAERCNIELLRFLLSEGRSITDIERRGPLVMLCSERGYADIVERLLQSGPILRSQQQSAITLASGPQNEQIREILSHAVVVDDSIVTGDYIEPGSLTLPSLSAVEEDPLSYFQSIIEKGVLPSRIYIAGSPVVDLGGITKEFVTRLFSGLVSKRIIPLYGDNKLLYSLECSSDTQKEMRKLGALYSLLYARNEARTDKALTGSVFDPLFFELLRMASIGAAEESRLNFLAERIQGSSKYAQLILNPEKEELQEAVVELVCCKKEEALDVAREELLKLVQASQDFYEGTSGSFKAAIASIEPSVLCMQLQGEEITPQKIAEAIRVENPSESLGIKLAWLLEKIHTSDDAFRKAFLHMVTGLASIRPGMEIRIGLTPRVDGTTFEAHTCFNSLDLPRTDMDKETFLTALEAVVYSSGYNIA